VKPKNLLEGKSKLYSFTLSTAIASFFLIILVDTALLIHFKSYLDSILMVSIGILYSAFFLFLQKGNKKEIFPIIVFTVSTAILSFIYLKNGFFGGSCFYFFPVTLGYINSSTTIANKRRFQFLTLIVLFISAIGIIQYAVIHPVTEISSGGILFTFRFIASLLFSGLLITNYLLLHPSYRKISKESTYQEALFHSYMDGYIIFDKETLEIDDYNESLVKMFDLPDTINFHGLYISQLMMRYLAEDSENLELLMNKIPDDWTGEATFLNYTKKRFDVILKSFSFVKEDNQFLLLTIRNITEITKAKEDLVIYKEKMEKAAKAKARFLSNMSHELRTPLNGIIGTSNLILTENNLPDNIINHINILRHSSEHMLGIINDILDFSKIDAGKLELNKHVFNMKESLDKLTKSFANEYERKKIELLFTHDPRIGTINLLSDQVKLRQVLANLLSNALKFTISGHVMLNVTIEELTEKSVTLFFEVEDTGIGIPKEKHQEIFYDFVQVNDNDLRRFDGTGLGLTISEKLVNAFGGKLQVESELEKGSRFYFTAKFDLAPEPVKTKQEITNDGVPPDIRGVRILMVEDNEINAGILRSFLLKWEIRIKEARNGVHALELLKYHKFDLILMDLEMPEMDGYTALKKIRETDTKTPIIAFTAALLENMDSLITESGFNDYVLKPFRPGDLKKKIELYAPHRKIEYNL
jgi:signal transduction histidine kinase